MKVLVIGAGGFIGHNLVSRLLEEKISVRAVTRNYRSDFSHKHLELVVSDAANLDFNLVLDSVTHIVYLASQSLPAKTLTDPKEDILNDILPLVRVLEAIKGRDDIHFTYVSSGGTVYGPTDAELVTEDTPLNPINFYGAIKVSCEKLIGVYKHLHKNKCLVLRPSNIYGPGQRVDGAQGLIAFLGHSLLNNKQVPIYGDGNIYRDYLYVSDFIEAVFLALNANLEGTYHVSFGEGYSINEVIECINKSGYGRLKIKRAPRRSFDAQRVVLDNTLLKQMLSWSPKVMLSEGISYTLAQFFSKTKAKEAA